MITMSSIITLRNKIDTNRWLGDWEMVDKLTLELKRINKIRAIQENKRKATLNKLIQELEQPRLF